MNLMKYGLSGAAGLLLGVGVVIWSQPDTKAGVTLILVVCILVALVLRGMFRLITGK